MVGLSLVAALALAELFLRLAAGNLTGRPSPASGLRVVGGAFPASHDPELGHVPTAGFHGVDNPWNLLVTITADGVRANGPGAAPSGRPILAVGDSYTFGDEVGDADTWPARLETLVGRPVVNGGVFGYGLDQIVMRAERLLERVPADTLVMGLIFDDIIRIEYAYRYAWKPWFEVADGALVLRGVPVPEPGSPPPREPPLRGAMRASFLADWILRRVDPEGWLLRDSIRAHQQGPEVSLLLIDRLAEIARARGLRVLLVLQWVPGQSDAPARPVVEHAKSLGLSVLEVEPLLRDLIDAGQARVDELFHMRPLPNGNTFIGHMTAQGNARVASWIAPWIRQTR